jgi:hypothetical protein
MFKYALQAEHEEQPFAMDVKHQHCELSDMEEEREVGGSATRFQ